MCGATKSTSHIIRFKNEFCFDTSEEALVAKILAEHERGSLASALRFGRWCATVRSNYVVNLACGQRNLNGNFVHIYP